LPLQQPFAAKKPGENREIIPATGDG